MLNLEKTKMKHEIEIPDLPEGWEPVEAMIDPDGSYFGDDGNQYANAKIKLKKKQTHRIVLDESDIDNYDIVYRQNGGTTTYWKIVEDNKCAE